MYDQPSPQQIEASKQKLALQLFQNPKLNTYAVLDGAANPGLLDHLYSKLPEFACLYRGELEPDEAECAPYLVKLEANTPFANWLIDNYWGSNWGIFALSDCEIDILRRHLRQFNLVYDPVSNGPLLFRYYDPRVLRIYLPTCDPEQSVDFFGPVQVFLAEMDDGISLASFSPKKSTRVQIC